MAESKLECTDSYVLPTGPRGEKGPTGSYGVTPTAPPEGPTGDNGISGRSKIDIIFQGENSFNKELNGVDNLYNSASNRYSLLGTFIYPGNTAFGGDPSEMLMLIETSGVGTVKNYNALTFTNMSEYNNALTNDGKVAASKILTTGSIISKDTDNGVTRIVSVTGGLDQLPDTEALIGIYIKNPEEATTVMKFYSAELY